MASRDCPNWTGHAVGLGVAIHEGDCPHRRDGAVVLVIETACCPARCNEWREVTDLPPQLAGYLLAIIERDAQAAGVAVAVLAAKDQATADLRTVGGNPQ